MRIKNYYASNRTYKDGIKNNKRYYMRLAIVDDFGVTEKVLATSPTPLYKYPKDGTMSFDRFQYEILMEFNGEYDFTNYDDVPPMEFQTCEEGKDEWKFYSDPIDDFFNL